MSVSSRRSKLRSIAATSKFDRSSWPDWLNTMSDDQAEAYFAEHPTSIYNPDSAQQQEETDFENKHRLPLYRRLTFSGWAKSAPTKELKEKVAELNDRKDELADKLADVKDILDDLKDQQGLDRQVAQSTSSDRKKERMNNRIDRRNQKIAKVKSRVAKLRNSLSLAKKKVTDIKRQLAKRKVK